MTGRCLLGGDFAKRSETAQMVDILSLLGVLTQRAAVFQLFAQAEALFLQARQVRAKRR